MSASESPTTAAPSRASDPAHTSDPTGASQPTGASPNSSQHTGSREELLAEARSHVINMLRANQRARAACDFFESVAMSAAFHLVLEGTGGMDSPDFDLEMRTMAAEIGMETRASSVAVINRMSEAARLHARFPATSVAFAEGDLTREHVRAIIETGEPLREDDVRAEFESLCVSQAAEMTPTQLRTFATRLAAELDPSQEERAQESAFRDRHVHVRDLGSGMSELLALLPSPVAHAIYDRLTQLARASDDAEREAAKATQAAQSSASNTFSCVYQFGDAHSGGSTARGSQPGAPQSGGSQPGASQPGGFQPNTPHLDQSPLPLHTTPHERRRFGQIRADAFADLLLGGDVANDSPHAPINAIEGRVAVTVPALSMVGASDEPAMHDGVGPIPLETAMRLCGAATVWQRVLTDPVSGEALSADTYRPSAALRRFIETRDQHCRAPGCRRKSMDCDLDHTREWANGGATTASNLAALCRVHHVMRHRGWTLTQSARGELTWASPSGRKVVNRPQRLARPWTPERVRESHGVQFEPS